MTSVGVFEPSKHLTLIDGRDYLEVKWRLVWLRAVHPDASIETEMVREDGQAAVFRAKVTLSSGASATGWGSEDTVGFRDYIEKAETKALGRALAALGFGTQFCADHEIGSERHSRATTDVQIDARELSGQPDPQRQRSRPQDPATDNQVKALYAIARSAALSNRTLDEMCRERFGCELSGLTRRIASGWIDELKKLQTVPSR